MRSSTTLHKPPAHHPRLILLTTPRKANPSSTTSFPRPVYASCRRVSSSIAKDSVTGSIPAGLYSLIDLPCVYIHPIAAGFTSTTRRNVCSPTPGSCSCRRSNHLEAATRHSILSCRFVCDRTLRLDADIFLRPLNHDPRPPPGHSALYRSVSCVDVQPYGVNIETLVEYPHVRNRNQIR